MKTMMRVKNSSFKHLVAMHLHVYIISKNIHKYTTTTQLGHQKALLMNMFQILRYSNTKNPCQDFELFQILG